MPKVELIYAADCPNAVAARSQLARALASAGLPATWQEWEESDPDAPPHVRGYGSPTVLVGGRDVAGARAEGSSCCRVYRRGDGRLVGAPSVETLVAALSKARAEDQGR